jgi:hypothetical protein
LRNRAGLLLRQRWRGGDEYQKGESPEGPSGPGHDDQVAQHL